MAVPLGTTVGSIDVTNRASGGLAPLRAAEGYVSSVMSSHFWSPYPTSQRAA